MVSAAALHSTGSSEWYSPHEVALAAHACMGGVDLDPASCDVANQVIRASLFFAKEHDGLLQPWGGMAPRPRVFLNPPSPPKPWWCRLSQAYECGHVAEAVYVAYSVEQIQQSIGWASRGEASPMTKFPICFPARRVRYLKDTDGKLMPGASPSHSSAIVGVGIQAERFAAAFGNIGPVMVPR